MIIIFIWKHNNKSSVDGVDSELDINSDNQNDDIETDNAYFISVKDTLSDFLPPAVISSRFNLSNRSRGNRSRAHVPSELRANLTL